jgi:hypothetical protein
MRDDNPRPSVLSTEKPGLPIDYQDSAHGEFDGITLQQTVSGFGWKYVSRTSYNITIYADDEPFSIETLAAMLPKGCYKKFSNCTITQKKYGPVLTLQSPYSTRSVLVSPSVLS